MLYRALRLYPNSHDGTCEYVYPTGAVKRRLKSIKKEIESRHIYLEYVMDSVDNSLTEYLRIINGEDRPMLYVYLRLAQDFGWDISRDVSYAYAEVLYPPEEIERRARRIFPLPKHLNGVCFMFESVIGFDIECISATIRYKKHRSLYCYGMMMHYMMREERRRGYSDALDFEE